MDQFTLRSLCRLVDAVIVLDHGRRSWLQIAPLLKRFETGDLSLDELVVEMRWLARGTH